MAIKVGIYDEPQVKVQQAPGGGLSTQVPNFGAAVGQGLQDVASVMDQVAAKEDALRVEAQEHKLRPFNKITEKKILSVQGETALKAVDGESPFLPYESEWKTQVAILAAELDTPRQKAMFTKVAEKHYANLAEFTAAHQGNEKARFTASVKAASTEFAKQDLFAASADPKAFEAQSKVYAAAVQAQHEGLDVSALVATETSKDARQYVELLIKGGKEVGDENGKFAHLFQAMTPEDRKHALMAAEDGDVANKALGIAIASYDPDMSVSDAQKLAQKQSGGNAKLYDAILHRYQQDIVATNADMSKRKGELMGEMQLKVQASPGSVDSLIAEARVRPNLNAEARGDVVTWLQSYKKALQAEWKRDARDPETHFALYAKTILDPRFKTLTKDELLKILPNYGSYSEKLLAAWVQATADGGRVTIPPTVKDQIMKDLNIKPKNAEAMATLDKALIKVSDDFTAESKGKGRFSSKPPEWGDVYKAVRDLIEPVKTVDSMILRDERVAPINMTPEQVQSALKLISPTDMKLIKTHLSANGMPTDPLSVFRAQREVEAMRTSDPELYTALWNSAGATTEKR